MDKGLEKNITIADVAEALGVSKTTVSRAISGKGRIGRETRERVLGQWTPLFQVPPSALSLRPVSSVCRKQPFGSAT